MDRRSKWLLSGVAILTTISVAATFYRTVVLQDFDVTGVWIEFTEEGGTYAWFYYDNVEYEVETEVSEKSELLFVLSDEIGTPVNSLDADFVQTFDYAYQQASLEL